MFKHALECGACVYVLREIEGVVCLGRREPDPGSVDESIGCRLFMRKNECCVWNGEVIDIAIERGTWTYYMAYVERGVFHSQREFRI